MLTEGRTDRQTNGWKLARLSRPAKAGAAKTGIDILDNLSEMTKPTFSAKKKETHLKTLSSKSIEPQAPCKRSIQMTAYVILALKSILLELNGIVWLRLFP